MKIGLKFDGGVDKFIKAVKGAASKVDVMEDEIIRQAGKAGLENVIANMKVNRKTGGLIQSLGVGGVNNIFEVSAGGGRASVHYGSSCPYVVPTEEGYNQLNRVGKNGKKPSLWVPGTWSGGDFKYQPWDGVTKGGPGMMLSGRFVPGQHMFEKSMPDTKADYKTIARREVKLLFKELF